MRAVSWEPTHTIEWMFSLRARLDSVDFDVLVHTNVLEVGGYADEPPLEQRAAAQAHLFRQLYDPDRQRAVINIDGAPPSGLAQSVVNIHRVMRSSADCCARYGGCP